MENKLYNPLNPTPSTDVTNEEWYQNANAEFSARMMDFRAPGQPGSYSNYLLEARKYKSNFDPLETLGYLNAQRAIDSNWEYAQNLGKSLYNGGIGVVRDTLNGIRAARDYNIALLNEQAKAQGFERNPDQDFINALDNTAKADVLQPYEVKQSASKVGQFGLDVAQGAGQLVGQMAGSVAANAVLPGVGGMALMVGQITGGQYEDLKAKGVDTKRAATAAFWNAMIQAPFEYMSLTRLMKRVPAGSVLKKKLKMVLEDMLTEGTTEAIQQFPEEWAELWALNPDKSWKELQALAAKKFPDTLQNALYAGLIGGVLGAGSRGIHIAVDRNIDLALRKELHDERSAAMESRINHIKQSGISPDYAGETVNANLNNATVLIDGDTLNAYAQRVGEEKAAEKLGVTVEEIREAAEKGDTVEIKQGNFEALSASDPSFYQEVKDDLSFDANDMSNRKYNQIQVNIENYSKLNEQKRTELKGEVDKIAATLEEAGANKSMVAAWKAFYTSAAIAARPDNPAQWVRDNPLRFERGVTRMTQPSLNFSSREDDLNLVKDILTVNYENPRAEVENRLNQVEEQIRQISDGERAVDNEQEVPKLAHQRDVLRTLLNDVSSGDGVASVPSIEDYKNIYDRKNGTFNVPQPGQYNQAMTNLTINLDEEVVPINLDEKIPYLGGLGKSALESYIREIASHWKPIPIGELNKSVRFSDSTDKYGQRHVIYSNPMRRNKINVAVLGELLSNYDTFEDVVKNARLVEVTPNTKKEEITNEMDRHSRKRAVHKGKVNQYYRFFLPVIHNNQGYTLVITCEEHNGELQLSKDEDLHLYEMSTVGINNKRSTDPERSSTTRAHPSGIPAPKYNIRQMLKNVKGIDGKPYIDKNGMPNWGETVQQLEGPLDQDQYEEENGNRVEYNQETDRLFNEPGQLLEQQKAQVRSQYEGTDGWMKAPNGKPTNLTEDQWVTVRTPAFKNWFGDWEVEARYSIDTDIKVHDKESLYAAAERFVNKTLENKTLNLNGIVSKSNLHKMASRKAIDKSVNDEIHFIAAANVDKLFQWAEVDITHPDRDNDPNIKQIHRVYSPMFVKGKPYVAKLTVKEIITSKRNVIYTVEALEIEKPTMESYDAYAKMNLDPTSYPIVGSIDILIEKLKNVNASKIVDENGEPRPFYHGTQRADRVGDTFLPERATSGPMAFFTSSKEIATNYAKDKIDTSLLREGREYKDQFTVTLPNGKKVNIVDYWKHLSAKEKNAIREAAGHVTFDDEADGIISDPNVTYGVGDLEYKIKSSNGNVLQALVDEWLTDGNIWGSEEKFLDVLKLAGVKAEVEYLDPKKVVSGVFDVYLNIRNPFNTNNIDEQFIKDLEEASKSAEEYQGNVSDMWDKGRQTPAQFVERVKSDYEAGTTHAWTSIPDWVTDLLKSKGHDGILDKGGKNGGQIHDVAIPFASNQIKDATGRNVGFNPETGNIYKQENAPATQTKGSFDPFTDGEAVIKLFEGADASTVIHETGHYYIESMWREIEAGRATEQQKADFEKLMKYCGITTAQWAKMDLEGRRAAHERLAEAIETYVMEDKAPTRELRPVFKRFAKWLKAVYSAISRNRNAVPLTDEVREVFDRMLASEEDVEQMRRVEGYFEKLPAVITDNLSDATKKRIEDYILKAQDKAVEILTKERLANFTEERKEKIENFRNMISDEVREEVANRPLYVAARQVREVIGGDNAAAAKSYARQYLDNKMAPERIVEWSIVAEQNGMTPNELARKLIDEPNETEAYNAAMNEAVQKEFPDYYTDRAQAEEATRQAMYNDESGILLGVEQVLVEDFANRAAAQQRSADAARKLAMAKRQQAKVAAQKELANMKLKDATRVDRFIAAERRCAVKSAEAMANKDYETARHYKDMQAFNHACVIESANLRKRKQQYDKLLRRLYRAKRETWTSEQHFNQAMALFARMGLMNPQYDPTTRTQSLVEYVNEMSEMFYPFNEIPNWLADETFPITDPKNMRFEDYEKVVDLMRYIKTMAKVEKAANFFDSNSTYQEWRNQAIDNLNKLATKFAPVLGERQTAAWIDRFQAAFQTLDNFLEKMDGWRFGFFSRTFGDAIKHANDNEFVHIEAYQKRKAEIEQAWCPDDKTLAEKAQDVYYEELGASASKFVLTKMLMNLGNEGNARKLCSSYPSEALRGSSLWVFENGMLTKDEAIAQTKENLLEFLGKVLTKEDIAYAQAKIDLAGMYWGEMADLDRRTKGFTPKKVEAYPVTLTLANGEQVVFRGGYFPLIRNGEMGSHPVGVMPVSDTDPNQGKNIRTMHTDTGHMISRVEAEYPVDLTEGSEDRAMRAAIHDLCWRETMTGFRRILNDQFMFGLMKSKLGIADMQSFREMLEHAAQPNGGASMAMGEGLLATTAGWLRRKTVNSIVMLNLRINLQNFGNLFLYGNTVEGFGYSDVLGAIGNAFSNGFEGRSFFEMWDFVDKKSAFMRSRSETPDITLADLRDEGKLNKYERGAMKWGARAMMYTDGLTARPVWMQAYTKKMNAGATEQEAIDFADTIIRRTLGSGRVTDVSSLQRGGPVYKLFTAFQGFFNTQFNQWMREYNIDRRLLEEGNTAEAVQRITAFVASKYLAACFFNLVLALQNPIADDDDDEYKNYTTELMHYPMSLVGIYGPVVNFAMDKTLGIKAYSYRMSIIESSLDKVYRASGKMGKIIDGDFEAGLEGLTDVAGIAAGVPAQMNRLFWNAYDIVVNGMDPKLEDLATRRPKRERNK